MNERKQVIVDFIDFKCTRCIFGAIFIPRYKNRHLGNCTMFEHYFSRYLFAFFEDSLKYLSNYAF